MERKWRESKELKTKLKKRNRLLRKKENSNSILGR